MSSGRVDASSVQQAMHTMRGYFRDLLDAIPAGDTNISSRFSSFGTKLRLVANCVEKGDELRWIAAALHARGGNPRAWFQAVSTGESRPTPTRASTRLAHRYLMLLEIKKNTIDLRTFVSTLYAHTAGFSESFKQFRDEYVEGLNRDFESLFRFIAAELIDPNESFDAKIERACAAFDDSEASPVREVPLFPAKAAPKKAGATRKSAAPKSATKQAAKKKAGPKKAPAKKTASKKSVKK